MYEDTHRGSFHVETNPREGEKKRLIGDQKRTYRIPFYCLRIDLTLFKPFPINTIKPSSAEIQHLQ